MKLNDVITELLCSPNVSSLKFLPDLILLTTKIIGSLNEKINEDFVETIADEEKSKNLFKWLYETLISNILALTHHRRRFGEGINKEYDMQELILIFIQLLCKNAEFNVFMNTQAQLQDSFNLFKMLGRYLVALMNEIDHIRRDRIRKNEKYAIETDWSNVDAREELCHKRAILVLRSLTELVQRSSKEFLAPNISHPELLRAIDDIIKFPFIFSSSEPEKVTNISNYKICQLKNECIIMLLRLMERLNKNDNITRELIGVLDEESILENIRFVHYNWGRENNYEYSRELLNVILYKSYREILMRMMILKATLY